jgi:hypothetical protein
MQKINIEMKLETPTRCNGCGKKEKNFPEGTNWIAIAVPIPGVMFLACPYCFSVYTNTNIVQCLKEVNEIQSRRVQPVRGMPGLIKSQ